MNVRDPSPRRNRWRTAVALVCLAACDRATCRWTDDPDDNPWVVQTPNRSYRTDDDHFEVVLRPDQTWPPAIGITSVVVEWRPVDPELGADATLSVERPFLSEGDLVADIDPVPLELDAMRWRVTELQLDAPGVWIVPLTLGDGETEDAIDLGIRVSDPDGG